MLGVDVDPSTPPIGIAIFGPIFQSQKVGIGSKGGEGRKERKGREE